MKKARKESTVGEILLWQRIKRKALGIEFHRQVPIDNFVVDFYCHELKLAVEIDGGSHNDELVGICDIKRQQRLESLGVRFIRFSEHDVRCGTDTIMKMLVATIESLRQA